MFQRQAGGAERLTGYREGGDLDDLALAAGRHASPVLRACDVLLGGDGVATIGRQHGKQGVLDGAHLVVHLRTILDGADSALSQH